MGLGRRGLISGQFLLRNPALDDIGNRLPRLPVQHENVAGLGRLDQRRLVTAIAIRDIIQSGLRRNVIVPDVVMNSLVSPALSPSLVVQRDN
ncbi:hypothetical protein D3C78_1753420 [compost metagenome]